MVVGKKQRERRADKEDAAAFDAFAADYDRAFTHTVLGRMLRQRVWDVAAHYFRAGDRVLELACGTGEDARWMAQQGVNVLATDGSAEMLTQTTRKTTSLSVTTQQVTLQEVAAGQLGQTPIFDGVLSNFGGLNTINNWAVLAEALAAKMKPLGKAVLVPMGPRCPIEFLWYLLHGQWQSATRRQQAPAQAKIGAQLIPIWYPSAAELTQAFAPWFRLIQTQSLGLWLPPSYLGHWVENRPRLWHQLNKLETKTARLTRDWGDHYIIVFERR